MSDFSISGTAAEVPADELDDPAALRERMISHQLAVDDPWIWTMIDPGR